MMPFSPTSSARLWRLPLSLDPGKVTYSIQSPSQFSPQFSPGKDVHDLQFQDDDSYGVLLSFQKHVFAPKMPHLDY